LRNSIWVVLFDDNYGFAECGNEMEQLLEIMPLWRKKRICQRTVLEGLGAADKIQIALEAAL
jgi:hypothetical protein